MELDNVNIQMTTETIQMLLKNIIIQISTISVSTTMWAS
jgi:hypothetical protein